MPAPANRIQVPELIHPIVQQIGQPPMVLPYVKADPMTMLDAAKKGIQLGQMIAALPQEGREDAYQYMMTGALKAHGETLTQAIKDIKARKDIDNVTKSQWISQVLARGGIMGTEQATTANFPAGLQAGIGAMNATAANPGIDYGFSRPMNAPVPQPQGQPQGQPQQDTELQNYQNSPGYE